MGGFWANIAKTSIGKKRTDPLDQARMQALQQILAAELNASAFGSVPNGGTGKFAEWENGLCVDPLDPDASRKIKNAQKQAAIFNESGDSGVFTPGISAKSVLARSLANKKFWDCIVGCPTMPPPLAELLDEVKETR
jgi:hypothetical protein